MAVKKYRKKPVVVEAIQVNWQNWGALCDFLGDALKGPAWDIDAAEASDTCGEEGPDYIAFHVITTHGERAVVRHGDWVIPDAKPGTFYPCKPDVFAATYEESGT